MSDVILHSHPRPLQGGWLIVAASAIALVVILIDYFIPHGTIAHMWGTLLVVISTALMLGASLLISCAVIPRWLMTLFEVLIILDILGTGICAYFLETWAVLVLMAVALIGWVMHIARDSARRPQEVRP